MKSYILALIGLVVVGGGVYLFAQNGSSLPTGDAILGQMYAEATEVDSASFSGSFDFNSEDPEQPGSFHADFEGASMSGGAASNTAKILLNANGSFGEGAQRKDFSGNLEFVGLDKEAYFKFVLGQETLAQVPFAPTLNDTWIRVSVDELSQAGMFPPEVVAQLESSTNLENAEKLKKIMLSNKILDVTKVEDGESIGGEETYKLTVSINEEGMVKAMNEWAALMEQPPLPAEQVAEFKSSLAMLEQYADMYLWVGQESKLPRKYSLVADLPAPGIGAGGEATADETVAHLDLGITIDSYNEPVEVIVPAESTSIMDILAPFLGGFQPAP
jgi:hypothetical protein